MIEQHSTQLRTDERALFMAILKRGQVLEYYDHIQQALVCYEDVKQQLHPVILECRARLAEEVKSSQEARAKLDAAVQAQVEALQRAREVEAQEKGKGKGKEKAQDEASGGLPEDNGDNVFRLDEDDVPDDWYYDDSTVGIMKNRLRNFLEVEHTALFFLGSAHYQLKTQEKKAKSASSKIAEYGQRESEYYEAAMVVRKEVLFFSRYTEILYIDVLLAAYGGGG